MKKKSYIIKRIKLPVFLVFWGVVGLYFTNTCNASYNFGAYQAAGTVSATTGRSRYMAMTSPDKDNMKVTKFGHKSNVAGNLRMALYVGGAAGNPDGATKVYDSGQLTHGGGGNWEEFDFSTPYNLAKNTQYGIAWKGDGASYYYDNSALGNLEDCDQYWDNLLNEPADSSTAFLGTLNVDATYAYTYLHYLVYVLYPTIDSISDDTIAPSQMDVQINGTGFEMDNEFGNNASKLYIGDADTYAGCTTTVEQSVITWSNTQITFTVNKGGLSFGANYVYVMNDDSEVNTNGFAVTLVDETPPLPPKETKRIKTVEYSFGGYYSNTDVGAGSAWIPAPITVYLPEDAKVIKSAFLEYSYWIANLDVTSLVVRFDQGTSAATARYSATGALSYDTGEHRRGHVLADVTSVIHSTATQQYAASVTVGGTATNMSTLKLYVTYEYDANSATQVKTVRFPIYSASNIAARTSEAAEGAAWQTYAFTYDADIAEAGITQRQQWFEVRGVRRYGSANHTGRMQVNINGGTASSAMYFDSSDETSYDVFFLSNANPSHAMYGNFQTNTSQTLNVQICNEDNSVDPAQLVLCGEAVLTYEYSISVPTKTKTVRYFLGQAGTADGNYTFTKNIYLNELGIDIKRIYAQIYGSYNNSGSGNIAIDSRVGATQEMPQRSYGLYAETFNTSGFSFLHDMTEEAGDWSNGEEVRLKIGSLSSLGGCGVELIITYDYTGENQYTDFYQSYAGQSSARVATGNTDNHNFDVSFPVSTPAGVKDLRNAWLLAKFEQSQDAGSTSANPSTTIGINSSNSQPVAHRTQTETHAGYVLYGNQGQISLETTSATANYSISADGASFCGKSHIIYERTPPPNEPYSLTQYKSDQVTELMAGQWTHETTAIFVMSSSSPLTTDSLTAEIEIQPVGTDFTDTANYIDDESLSYSGTPVVSTITVVGLTSGTTYHWQARVKGAGDYSNWISFGSNQEANMDFGVDQIDPYTANNMSGGDNNWRKENAGVIYDVDFFDDHSGLDYAQYHVNDSPGGTGDWMIDWTGIPGVSGKAFTGEWAVDFDSLVSGYGYVSVRVYDNVGKEAVLNDAFYIKKDTIPPVIDNDNMAGGDNNWRKSDPAAIYNVDFSDDLSLLHTAQYTVYADTGMRGDIVIDWIDIFTSSNVPSYTEDFGIDFDALNSTYNYVSIRCWDMAGSTRTLVDAFYVKKDTIPPLVPDTVLPADNAALNYSTVSFNWSDSADSVSGLENYELEVDNNIDFLSPAYSTVTAMNQSTGTSLSDGKYYFRVRAKDIAGNYSGWSSTRSIVVDTADPVFQGDFASKRQDSVWVSESEWNDNSLPDTRIKAQDTGSGLMAERAEYTYDNDTVLLMHFDEGSGLPEDESIYGNNAVYNDASWSTDTAPIYGSEYALDFNGSHYVNCGQDTSFDFDYFTVEAWVKFDDNTGNRVIASMDDGANRRWALYLLNGNTLRFFVFSGDTWVSPDYSWTPDTGTWYHIVGTKDDYVRTYINGQEAGTGQYQAGVTDKDNIDLMIGVGSYPGYFDGIIDEIRILDRALTADEVEADYSSGHAEYSTDGGNSWTKQLFETSGQNGTTGIQTSTAATVPLKESAGQNKVKFFIGDMAGNIAESGVFTVKVDSTPPTRPLLVSPQDESVTNSSLISFNWNDSVDGISGISSYTIEVSTSADLLPVFYSSVTAVSQISKSFNSDKYFWRVTSEDAAGNYSIYSVTHSFIIDLSSPSILNYQSGDGTWRITNNGEYNIDFSDNDKLDYFQVKADTGGPDLISWTTVITDIDSTTYDTDWQLPVNVFNSLLNGPTNQISIRVYDQAGGCTELPNAFYVKKDTIPPLITDLQSGNTTWMCINNGVYDIDYSDEESLLDYIQYRIVSGTGGLIADWYTYTSGISSGSYTNDFQLPGSHFQLLTSSYNYVSVRAFDVAGCSTTLENVFYIKKDTVPPVINDDQEGDDTWENSAGTVYDVNFEDKLSHIDYIQYRVYDSTEGDNPLTDWIDIVSQGYNQDSYDQDWQVSFDNCQEGFNYIWIRSFDIAGSSTTLANAFYIKKDGTDPQITDGQLGDDTWRKAAGAGYNVDFKDLNHSLLSSAEYKVTKGLGQTGGIVIDWTYIFSSTSIAEYTGDWEVIFSSLAKGYNYVSVRCADNAGNTDSLNDVFYVLKDTTTPEITDNQDGDQTWRSQNNGVYNIDYSDTGGSKLSYVQYQVRSGTGAVIIPWYTYASGINQNSYTADFSLSAAHFALLTSSYNYVSVTAFDAAGSSETLENVFYIKKDTAAPLITDGQAGDGTWRISDPGAVYNIDFSDGLSLLDYAQYTVYSGPGKTGNILKNWTNIFTALESSDYNDNWAVDFNYLVERSTNWVSVRVCDNAGGIEEKTDAFYVLKDTTSAGITDNQTGDFSWRGSSGNAYDVDFYDFRSGLLKAEYTVWTGPNRSGSKKLDWTLIFDTNTFQGSSYDTDWDVDFNSLLEGGTNWVSVKVYDIAGNNYALQNDVFYVKKDITDPWITDNQTGYSVELSSDPGKIFDVDFYDNIELEKAEYVIYSTTNFQGSVIKEWTPLFLDPGTTYYNQNWGVDFGACYPGKNYVSVRVFDMAGSSDVLKDVFYVKKAAAPIVKDNQAGDNTWRITNPGAIYDVDFSSSGYSLLSYFEICAYPQLNRQGALISTWTTVVSGINAPEYIDEWAIPGTSWDDLIQGKNHISVQVWDQAGKESSPMDVFYILKDTAAPVITDGQNGDSTWRNSNNGVYDVDFADVTSKLKKIEYRICSSPDGADEIVSWSIIADTVNANSYNENWQIESTHFNALLEGTSNWVSVRCQDNAGLTKATTDVFYILKDTTSPVATYVQPGTSTWRRDNSFLYNVDFTDPGGSRLDYFEVKACSASAQTGTLSDWTVSTSNINSNSYTTDWALPSGVFVSLLDETTNYISVRVRDIAGNISGIYEDVFTVKKDTSGPVIDNKEAGGDNNWVRYAGTPYDVDFYDNGSGLDYIQYKAEDSSGTLLIDWTNIDQGLGTNSYTTDWQVQFSSLSCGYNYISVRAFDNAGSSETYTNVFFIKKDTETPSVIKNQSGDDIWRSRSGTFYDVDFKDDKSLLNYIQYSIYSSTGRQDTMLKDWTYIASGINTESYTPDWQIDFSACRNGYNYVSVRVNDNLLNNTTGNDVFYLKKDILSPSIFDNQMGDDTWRKTNTGTYNIDFSDSGGSLLDRLQYKICSSTGQEDTVVNWYSYQAGVSSDSYTNDFQISTAHFSQLPEGKSYVSIKAIDTAGNEKVRGDVFYIKKDTTPPVITDQQSGDTAWRSLPGTVYNVDFSDSGQSLLSYAQYKIEDPSDNVLVNWYTFASDISSSSYTADWSVDTGWQNMVTGYNYVSVRVFDHAGNSVSSEDVFYVKKDTAGPQIQDNQEGDDEWKNAGGTIYDIDFSDNISMLDAAYYTVYASTGRKAGTMVKDWTEIFMSLNQPSYTDDWDIDFDSINEGINYVSVKAVNFGSAQTIVEDVFYVRKDTASPTVDNQETGGDSTWRSASGTVYDVNFTDTGSLLSLLQYTVYSSTGMEGDLIKSWTTVANNISSSTYDTDWQVNFASLRAGTSNYVSLRIQDFAGNTTQVTDAFYIAKDTVPPNITGNQAGDDTWRGSESGAYDVDFDGIGLSKLDKFETKVYAGPGQTGQLLDDYRTVESGIGAYVYTSDWRLEKETWDMLPAGTSYVTVKVSDLAGNTSSWIDIFHVKKDAASPVSENFETKRADETWVDETSWNDNVSPDARIETQDIASGLRIGRSELALSSGTVFLMHLDNNTTDYSRWENHGTRQGQTDWINTGTWKSTGGNEDILDFDGTNDWVDIDDNPSLDGMTELTIEAWVKDTGNDELPRGIVCKRAGVSSEYCYALFLYTGRNIYFDTAGSSDRDSSIFSLPANEWHHIAVTFNGNAVSESERKKIYYDGELDSAHSSSNASIPDEDSKLRIGILNADYGNSWEGQVDEVRILDRALTAEEIAADYNSGCIKYTTDGGNSWTIEPSVSVTETSGLNGTADIQISTATSVPLKESDSQSKVKFIISDMVGNISESGAYTVKIDSTSPTQVNLLSPADDSNINTTTVDFDWNDVTEQTSGLECYELLVSTLSDFSVLTSSSLPVSSGDNVSLAEDSFWWKARAKDNAGNYGLFSSTRYFIVDVTTPAITDNQDGDEVWRTVSGSTYNVDFTDTGGSLLDYIKYTVWTGQNQTGEQRKVWSDVTEVTGSSYTDDWQLDFVSLKGGKNYVSVRCADKSGNFNSENDIFYVLKDTAPPVITDAQAGDTVWRNANDGTYDVSYYDSGGSFLDHAQYQIESATGAVVIPWYTYASAINASSYDTDLAIENSHFEALTSSCSYVSVRVYDNAGSSDTVADAFYIKRDTIPPAAITDFSGSPGTEGKISLTWTVTGDDGYSDYLEEALYELRYTQDDMDTWDTADYSIQIPTDTSAGGKEGYTITGLTASATYYIWIKIRDKAMSWSPISNSTSTTAGADVTAPGQIDDLYVEEGSYPGQIELIWTAPGDNGTIGNAAGYELKYATFEITGANYDSCDSWDTSSWIPLDPESTENKVLADLDHTKTYWFAIKAYDEAPNYAVMSNTASAIPGQPGAADGIMVYGKGGTSNPQYRTFNSGSFGTETPVPGTFAGNIRWVILRSCNIMRDEKILGVLSDNGTLYISRWNGTSWSEEFNVTDIGAANSVYRGFDIAYEQNSGRCVVAWSKGTSTDEIGYKVWTSTAWLNEQTIDLNTSDVVYWVKMVPGPGTDNIMMTTLDASNDVFSVRWTGGTWQNGRINTASSPINTEECFDMAWETQSGKCLVVWAEGTQTKYDIFYSTSSTWHGDGPFNGPQVGAAANVRWIRLASDPTSDRIGFASLDSGSDWNVCMWDNGWGSLPAEDGGMELFSGRCIDIGWERNTGRCVALGVRGGRLTFNQAEWISSGGWNPDPANSTQIWGDLAGRRWDDDLAFIQLVPDPNTDKMSLIGISIDADLRSANRTGTGGQDGWQNSFPEHCDPVPDWPDNTNQRYQPVMLSLDLYDPDPPTISDNQSGDDIWRKDNTATYNVDFNDTGGSKLSRSQTKVCASESQKDILDDWRDVVTGINNNEYTTDWNLAAQTWNSMQQGFNYVSIKAFDGTGNSAEETDAFYVKKDTGLPTIGDNQAGDNNWYKEDPGNIFNVDFSDSISKLDKAQYVVYFSTNMEGAQILDWQTIFDLPGPANYINEWGVKFSSLTTGKNHISARVYDNAGNYKLEKDIFYVNKDTVPPLITDLQDGDTIWQKISGKVYNVDFQDYHSLLDDAQYCVSSSSDNITGDILSWSFVFIDKSSTSYEADWSIDFDSLKESATNWVSVRCFDVAQNTGTLANAFYVLKDTTPPVITDNQTGDETWRTSGGTVYNVDFEDTRSRLKNGWYKVYKGTWTGSEAVMDWTGIFNNLNTSAYNSDWQVNFSSLSAGYNYVWVKTQDYAGNAAESDTYLFYIKKSTNFPVVTGNQAGDDKYRRINNGYYDVDFNWGGIANLDYFMTRVTTGANHTGILVDDWRTVVSNINSSAYNTNWQIKNETWNLLKPGKNYVSAAVYDAAGVSDTIVTAFYILKDTSAPVISNNEAAGDINWRTSSGTEYDIDFEDTLSGLDTAQYRVKSSTGGIIIDWQDIFSSTNVTVYSEDFEVDFNTLKAGVNYVDIRSWDNAGSTNTVTGAFYIKKDTSPPQVIDNQAGDNVYRDNDPGNIYNIDFRDTASKLDKAQYTICDSTDMGGNVLVNWTDIFSGLNQQEYTSNWAVAFSSLTQGYNYVSVRVYDYAGHVSTGTDVFYIRKDTAAPSISNHVSGDDTWRSNSITYNVDFSDHGSLLYEAQYKVCASSGQAGDILKNWTSIFTGLNQEEYTTNWSVNFTSLNEGKNYLSLKVKDNAFNETVLTDAFYILKDTTSPTVTDTQAGDDNWMNASGTVYDVDFHDTSSGGGLSYARYQVKTGTGGIVIDWTDITGVSGYDWTTDWQINFAECNEGVNYVFVKAADLAGNTTNFGQAFYLKKDSIYPEVTNNETGGDGTWRNSSRSYDVDFYDATSNLKDGWYKVISSTGSTVIDWTYIFQSTDVTQYTQDWNVAWDNLQQGFNYVRVRVKDYADNQYQEDDIFFIKKDTTPPAIDDQQAGDDTWRSSNDGYYDVNFTDSGGSLLDRFQIKVTTGQDYSGILISDWADVVTDISSNTYDTDWQIPETIFNDMQPGVNYVHIKVFDVASSSAVQANAFYVKKDTSLPKVTLNFSGDDTWQPEAGTHYDVDFDDYESKLSTGYYRLKTSAGGIIKDWTVIFSSPGISSFDNDWEVDFASLKEGTNYVDVKVYDGIGNFKQELNLFYIKKDTTAPVATDNQDGDDTWRNANNASYDIDFNDAASGSGISGIKYKIDTSTGGTIDWYTFINDAGYSYEAEWQISGSHFNLLPGGTNYVSVGVSDYAGSSDTIADAFYIRKDTVTPVITDLQDGDTTWRNAPGTAYNVDFTDSGGSKLKDAQYIVKSSTGMKGNTVIDWTDIFTNLNQNSYTTDWEVDFYHVNPGSHNYVSIRVYDYAGSSDTVFDAFFVSKQGINPQVIDNQTGDDTWYASDPGAIFDVDFMDTGENLDRAYYTLYSSTGMQGSPVKSWTEIFSSLGQAEYTSNWEVDFFSAAEGYNYVSVEVYNVSGASNTVKDVFYLKKDVSKPAIDNSEAGGDNKWRNSSRAYNVDFSDAGSGLNYIQYQVWSQAGQSGTLIKNWTTFASGINNSNYTADWEVNFPVLQQGYNYVTARAYDNLNKTNTFPDIFYIKKDMQSPSIADNQTGDDTWYSSDPGAVYNVDFSDSLSKFTTSYYSVYSSSYITGVPVQDWTLIVSTYTSSYTQNWGVGFNSWPSGLHYVFVKARDSAGNEKIKTDYAFYVKKDTESPTITDNQSGDYAWHSSSGTLYNIDSSDNKSLLDYVQYKVVSGIEETVIDWYSFAADINAEDYNTDFSLTSSQFDQLVSSYNYVNIKAVDKLGNTATIDKAFYIKKDTVPPVIEDNQVEDSAWYSSNPGAVFDIDFKDTLSGVATCWYCIYTSSDMQGTQKKGWTVIAGDIDSDEYTNNWGIAFSACQQGYNYVSVKVNDYAGKVTEEKDVFIVRKDITVPAITDNQAGDENWYGNNPGAIFNLDFSDAGGSLLKRCEYKVHEGDMDRNK
ncbi:MAG: LamG-like jellyroll fold domain-containing protein [Elusimicrobiota bacterium]